ncbi:MAG: hypothetical protein R6X35_09810 [Candidatus Krumholzibacteriia bacterium]
MTRTLPVLLLIGALLAPGAAVATELQAGWTRADLGLDQDGDGFMVGVGGVRPLGAGPFDLAFGGEYVRKRGVQPLMVASPELGLVRADAEVTLHCLQATGSLGASLPVGGLRLRPYAGAAIAIKLDETWDRVEGPTGRDYGYDDLDLVLHLGLQVRFAGRFFVDGRYSQGLLEQVVERDGEGFTKAIDPLTGAELPEAGDTVSWVMVGAGVSF